MKITNTKEIHKVFIEDDNIFEIWFTDFTRIKYQLIVDETMDDNVLSIKFNNLI